MNKNDFDESKIVMLTNVLETVWIVEYSYSVVVERGKNDQLLNTSWYKTYCERNFIILTKK